MSRRLWFVPRVTTASLFTSAFYRSGDRLSTKRKLNLKRWSRLNSPHLTLQRPHLRNIETCSIGSLALQRHVGTAFGQFPVTFLCSNCPVFNTGVIGKWDVVCPILIPPKWRQRSTWLLWPNLVLFRCTTCSKCSSAKKRFVSRCTTCTKYSSALRTPWGRTWPQTPCRTCTSRWWTSNPQKTVSGSHCGAVNRENKGAMLASRPFGVGGLEPTEDESGSFLGGWGLKNKAPYQRWGHASVHAEVRVAVCLLRQWQQQQQQTGWPLRFQKK